MPLRKLLITPWFGPLPEWFPHYEKNIEKLKERGFDWLPLFDLGEFAKRVRATLGVDCPIVPGSGKIHDFRAAFGEIFSEEIETYDFWGHTDFDCVYGRLERFVPDDLLEEIDVYSDCCSDWKSYVCGPLALFRNRTETRSLFREHPDWKDILSSSDTTGWVETSYTDVLDESALRVHYQEQHVWKPNDLPLLHWDGDRLMLRNEERSMAHFRRTKTYPLGLL